MKPLLVLEILVTITSSDNTPNTNFVARPWPLDGFKAKMKQYRDSKR